MTNEMTRCDPTAFNESTYFGGPLFALAAVASSALLFYVGRELARNVSRLRRQRSQNQTQR